MRKLVECVPNISEGRNREIIDAVVEEICSTKGATLLDVDPGADTNRTVITFVGEPDPVVEAAFKVIKKAGELIDMSQHKGAHARHGATDVCPFVPVANITMEECAQLAGKLGARVGEELEIPIYLYEYAAAMPERKNLAQVRQGEYEALSKKLGKPEWKPDFGLNEWNQRVAKTGATNIGAREFLIAYNVNLNSKMKSHAHNIALNIREKGRWARGEDGKIRRDAQGKKMRNQGVFKECKAVGWVLEEHNLSQISINLTNHKITSMHQVFDECCRQAQEKGLRITGSEVVGLVPLDAILEAADYYLKKMGIGSGYPQEELIDIAVRSLGLDDFNPFDPQKKIIEYAIGERFGPLAQQKVSAFCDQVSTDSPAPGGGSVAALCGSLSASLAAMVVNLSEGKKEYRDVMPQLRENAALAQRLKDDLLLDIDRDTESFNRVMEAFKAPKATRKQAVEEANKGATLVPLKVMERALESLKTALLSAQKGNKNSISDAGVAGWCGLAAAEGAYLNVKINLTGIFDEKFKQEIREKSGILIKNAQQLNAQVQEVVTRELEKL